MIHFPPCAAICVGEVDSTWFIPLVSPVERHSAQVRPVLLAILGAALFMLLAACGSVAGTLVSRMASRRSELAMRLALGTKRGQTYMDVHESDGTLWLNKERFEELARFLAEREAASGRITPAAGAAEAESLAQLAEREGYRVERIAAKLGPAPKIDPAPARAPAAKT